MQAKEICVELREEQISQDLGRLTRFRAELAAGLSATERRPDLSAVLESGDYQSVQRALAPGILRILITNSRMAPDLRPGSFVKALPGSLEDAFPHTVPAEGTYQAASWNHDLVYGGLVAWRLSKMPGLGPLQKRALIRLAEGSLSAVVQNQVDSAPNLGMISHMNYLRDPKFMETFGHPYSSYISQPPVVGDFVRSMNRPDIDIRLIPALHAYADWWLAQRLDKGLVFTPHPWELGTDALPSLDVSLLPRWGLKTSEFSRLETDNPGLKDSFSKNARFNLAQAIKEAGGINASGETLKKLMNHKSPVMNAYVVMYLQDTAAVSRRIAGRLPSGEATAMLSRAERYSRQAREISDEVNSSMWNEKDGTYYALSAEPDVSAVKALEGSGVSTGLLRINERGQVPRQVLGAYITLAAGIPSLRQAEAMLAAYRRDFATPVLGASVAPHSPGYVHNSYWRGSVWINENYWVARGFIRYGEIALQSGKPGLAREFFSQAEALCRDSLRLVEKEGYCEYYSSKDGKGEGPRSFTWSGLVLNMTDLAALARSRLAGL